MMNGKWDKLLEGIEDPPNKKIIAAMLKNQAAALKSGATKVGPFEKFTFPLIRKAFPSLIGGEEEKQETPLSELAARAFADHDPTDEDWSDWVAEVETAYKLACQDEDQAPHEDLQKEWDRVQRIEHPEQFRRKGLAESIVSVQPMTQPVGGIAFYRPRYGTSKGPVEPGEQGTTGISGRRRPPKRKGKQKFSR